MAATPALATLTAEPDWNLVLAPLFTPRDLETPQIQCQLVFSLLTFLTLSIRDFLFFLFKCPIPMVKQRVGIFMGNHPTLGFSGQITMTIFDLLRAARATNIMLFPVSLSGLTPSKRSGAGVLCFLGVAGTRCRVPLGTTGRVRRTSRRDTVVTLRYMPITRARFGLAYGLVLEHAIMFQKFDVSSEDTY
ncbi:hypothetical protein B0H10DRAFT_1970789 [Mycena sp. CBHHK59/15]|nr:hypothetical protein B0H10DRAFT_1970789 [Mycena sp. CBHHK59/15]